jgi:hypothetical protein
MPLLAWVDSSRNHLEKSWVVLAGLVQRRNTHNIAYIADSRKISSLSA